MRLAHPYCLKFQCFQDALKVYASLERRYCGPTTRAKNEPCAWNSVRLTSVQDTYTLVASFLTGAFVIPQLHFIHLFIVITLIKSNNSDSDPQMQQVGYPRKHQKKWRHRDVCKQKHKRNSGQAKIGVKTSKPVATRKVGSLCLWG